jgi:hypothetical protein
VGRSVWGREVAAANQWLCARGKLQLGAEGLTTLPQEGPDGKVVPITPRPEGCVCVRGGGGRGGVAAAS